MNKKKIILVDDDFFYLQSMKEILEYEGFEVITANSFGDAKNKIIEHKDTSVIVLDIMMPSDEESDFETRKGFESGLALARWVKQYYPNINIIGQSGINSLGVETWFERHEIPFFLKGTGEAQVLNILLNMNEPKQLKTFIVHGHDNEAKSDLKNYLQNTIGLPEPIILHEQPSRGRTVIEKFEDLANQADLVFVLLTPDDTVYDSETPDEIKLRSRQNVIFEMGYFFGKLQRKKGRIILLYKGQLELPSDILGIISIDISNGIFAAGEEIRRELPFIPQK